MRLRLKCGDIDVLLVVPRFLITREEFSTELLEQIKADPWVTWAYGITGAYVLLIKIEMEGVCIDLLCARVDNKPKYMELEQHVLFIENWIAQPHESTGEWFRDGHAFDVHSFRALRATANICNLVYEKPKFKRALWMIRLWARSKNICSNVTGFPDGVS